MVTTGSEASRDAYAGQRLGLPADGVGSMAGLGRRVVGVLIDWIVAQLVTVFALGRSLTGDRTSGFVVLAVFAVLTLGSLAVVGATFGHWLMRLQLRRVRPGVWPVQVLVRTALLCLFLPAIFTDSDGRGWHDRIAGTVLVRR